MNSPSDLYALQHWMQDALVYPLENSSDRTAEFIEPAREMSADERLAIYQRSYYARLLECMRTQFKALNHTLGEELFTEFAQMYLREYPSKSPSLAHLGERFPEYLEENRPDEDEKELWIDFMIAMARFEVDLYRVFDQEGSEGEQMANAETEDHALRVQKCFALKSYPFDVNSYYQAIAEGKEPDSIIENRIHIVFVRSNYQVYVIPISEVQYVMLELLYEEVPVEMALEEIAIRFNYIPEFVSECWADWKKHWTQKGFFVEC